MEKGEPAGDAIKAATKILGQEVTLKVGNWVGEASAGSEMRGRFVEVGL